MIALAVLFMLSLLGVGIGSAVVDPATDASPLSGVGVGSGIFVIAAQLIALAVGAYAAALLAGIPLGMSSALHGAAVWALATFAMLFLATTTVGGMMGGASSLITQASSGAASAVGMAVPDDLGSVQVDPSQLPQGVQDAMEERGMTPEDLQADAQAVFSNTVSDSERQEIMTKLRESATKIVSSPGSAGEEFNTLVDELVGGENGVLSQEDRDEAVTSLSQRMGISKQEAEQTLDQWQGQVEDGVKQVKAAAATAQEEGVKAAQAATDALSKAALGAFAASLAGLLIAMLAGFLGRQTELEVSDARA